MSPRQCIGILCFVAFLPSCTTWQTYSQSEPPTDHHPVRVWSTDGRHFADSVAVADSSLVMFAGGAESRIPLNSVMHYEAREISSGGTAVLLTLVGAFIAFAALTANGGFSAGGGLKMPGSTAF